jgi:hypothetical protein
MFIHIWYLSWNIKMTWVSPKLNSLKDFPSPHKRIDRWSHVASKLQHIARHDSMTAICCTSVFEQGTLAVTVFEQGTLWLLLILKQIIYHCLCWLLLVMIKLYQMKLMTLINIRIIRGVPWLVFVCDIGIGKADVAMKLEQKCDPALVLERWSLSNTLNTHKTSWIAMAESHMACPCYQFAGFFRFPIPVFSPPWA